MKTEIPMEIEGQGKLGLPWERPEDEGRLLVPGRYRGYSSSRKRVVAEWGAWLQEFPLHFFVTATWSDKAAQERYIYADRSAVRDFLAFLRDVRFTGQYFGVVEDHRHRDVLHIHALLEDQGQYMKWYWQEWFASRGLFRSVPAEPKAFGYVAKYILKDGRACDRVFERLCSASATGGS